MTYAARRILYASRPGWVFECMRKHKCCTRDNKHLILKYVLTSRSFSRRDKVIVLFETSTTCIPGTHGITAKIENIYACVYTSLPDVNQNWKYDSCFKSELTTNLNLHYTGFTVRQIAPNRAGFHEISFKGLTLYFICDTI